MRIRINFKDFRTRVIEKYAKKLPLDVVGLLALFGVAIYIFSVITYDIIWQQEEEIDIKILTYLQAHVINPELTKVMKGITHLASAQFLQIGYGILIIGYLIPKHYRRAIEIFIVGASGLLVNIAMKYFFHRLRPPHPLIGELHSFSYPSGHATSGFIFYGLLIYLIWKTSLPKRIKFTAGLALFALAHLIGFSRIYLRVHYPSDVASGFAVGFAWLLLLIWLMEHLKKKAETEVVEEVIDEKVEQERLSEPDSTQPVT